MKSHLMVYVLSLGLLVACGSDNDTVSDVPETPPLADADEQNPDSETGLSDTETPDTTDGVDTTVEEEIISNWILEKTASVPVPSLVFAIAGTADGAVLACGEAAVFLAREEQDGPSWMSSAVGGCDAITILGESTAVWNSRTSGIVYFRPITEGDPEADAAPIAADAIGQPDAPRALDLAPYGQDWNGLAVARGDGGVALHSFDGETATIATEATMIEGIHALSVAGISESTWLAIGTPSGVTVHNTEDGTQVTVEIQNGANQLGAMETTDTGWRFQSTNPLGISSLHLTTEGELTLETTLATGSHPFVVRQGVASLWSRLALVHVNDDAEDPAQRLEVLGSYAETTSTDTSTQNTHYVDLLDAADERIVAATTRSIQWFSIVEHGAAPDIHVNNLVLKMGTPEEGGNASVLVLVENHGDDVLLVSDIALDNDKFTLAVDPDFAGNLTAYDPQPLLAVEPGTSGFFEVLITTEGLEAHVTKVTMTSNDPDEEIYTITARVNHPNVAAGFELPNLLTPDAQGVLHPLHSWTDKIVYLKLFNGL